MAEHSKIEWTGATWKWISGRTHGGAKLFHYLRTELGYFEIYGPSTGCSDEENVWLLSCPRGQDGKALEPAEIFPTLSEAKARAQQIARRCMPVPGVAQ